MNSAKNCYATLGVARAADSATIHSAFRALARQFHPDAGRESSSNKFREVLEAYRTLSDPRRRRQHDIDLDRTIRRPEVAAEPLFDTSRSRTVPIRPGASDWDELLVELLRFMQSECDTPIAFHRSFFY